MTTSAMLHLSTGFCSNTATKVVSSSLGSDLAPELLTLRDPEICLVSWAIHATWGASCTLVAILSDVGKISEPVS